MSVFTLIFAAWTALAAPSSPLAEHLQALVPAPAGWESAQRDALLAAWGADPETCLRAWEEAPSPTRAGFPRFASPAMRAPALRPLIVERLRAGGEDEATRAALAELLARSGPELEPALLGLIAEEQGPMVRRMLVSHLRWAEAEVCAQGLPLALGDADPGVRAEAAYVVGHRSDGARFAPSVVPLLSDAEPAVRAGAARALGWIAYAPAFDGLSALLVDPEPEVRLRSLRALERVDAARAAALPQLGALARDPDPRVARAAARLQAR
ncbi:MAG: HEAT repeat domain-containing protein [Deltaproteobacteria bacterium]|nr:HEAT repeat domain-containing protein [Deltaproteobacteria bacterium]